MKTQQVAILILVVGCVGAFFYFDIGSYLSLGYLNEVHADAVAYVRANVIQSTLGFMAFYILVTAASLPGAALMTLAAGAIFQFGWGLVMVSFASSIGATLAMLVSRSLLGGWVQERFGEQLEVINEGVRRDGVFYLFGLRMVPLFPFFIINLVMGLTRIGALRFYWVSQVGMLPGTLVYVFAGTQLATVTSLTDVLSPGLFVAFSLLGLFPIIARKLLGWLGARRERGLQS
tara:strand:- start:3154 stop:3849 length:696 start_codon:yes stop_codon:yes gene_type:complete